MLEYNIKNQDELTKSEFLSKAELDNLKTYSPDHIKAFAKEYKNLMSKAEVQELSEEENVQMEIFKSELETLKKVVVVNDNCQKENIYYRTKEDIIKSEAIENDFKALKEEERVNTLRKGFELGMIDENTLEKATGHKYFKREPKAGGGYKYYYTEAQYKKEKGGGEKKESKPQTSDNQNDPNKNIEAFKKLVDAGISTSRIKSAIKELKSYDHPLNKEKIAILEAKLKTSDNKEGGKSKVPTIKFVQDTINSWSKEKGIDYYLKVSDNSYKGNTEFYIEPHNYKGDDYDGMQISYDQKEGQYEVAEMMAGKNQENINIFLETKSLKSALSALHRGNKQKPKRVIDMSTPKK